MRSDEIEIHKVNGEAPLDTAQALPSERLFPSFVDTTALEYQRSISTLIELCRREILAYCHGESSAEIYSVELLYHALMQGNQEARAGLQQCLSELVQSWLYGHPCREAVLCWESEETYVMQILERFWQTTAQQQVTFRMRAAALTYLRACLNGIILDTMRAHARPREVPFLEPGAPGQPSCEDRLDSSELWEILQSMVPNHRERRLVYLLYHCGLGPREIVHFCPQEWPEIQEIYRLRRNILERLLHNHAAVAF